MKNSHELEPPHIDDYNILKDAVLEMLQRDEDAAIFVDQDGLGLSFFVDRYLADCDGWAWPPLRVMLSGELRIIPGVGSTMTLWHGVGTFHPNTLKNAVHHEYTLRAEQDEVTEFGHSMYATPKVPEPTFDYAETPVQQHYAELGKKLLQLHTGELLELTAGDCATLLDEVARLIPPLKPDHD